MADDSKISNATEELIEQEINAEGVSAEARGHAAETVMPNIVKELRRI